MPWSSYFSKLLTTKEILSFWSFRLFHSSCSTFQGFGFDQAVGQRYQCRGGWRTCLPRTEHGEPASSWLHPISGTGAHVAAS